MHPLYSGPELRAWQLEAISAWEKHSHGIIQAVPGAGKTILALKLLCSRIDSQPELKVLIVCPRLTLIQQWIDAILANTKIKRSEIYEVSSNNESRAYICAQDKIKNYKIFISTFHQIKQFFNECGWKEHEWLLIVDEMHNTTENYRFPDAQIKYKLGLSATPKKKGKGADFNLGGIVYTYQFSQALSDKIILDPVIKIVFYSVNKQLFKKIQNESDETIDLVESAYDDFLPDEEMIHEHQEFVKHQHEKPNSKSSSKSTAQNALITQNTQNKNSTSKNTYNYEISREGKHKGKGVGEFKGKGVSARDSKGAEVFGAGTASAQAGALAPQEEPDIFTPKNIDFIGIQRILQEQFHIGGKDSVQTLVFVNRIKKADLLNQMLAEKFSESVSKSYHSKSEQYSVKNYFNELKKQFSEGKFNVLISVGTLGEGIDFPYASHGIIASPIYNPTSFVQKVGRLLRAYKDHKKAVIYYYVPSELVSRLLTDEKIEPNYFKSVIKIADENGDLYFVDRESLVEERGSLSELLIKGAAYERNDDIRRIKIPHDLDAIMRFFKRVHPENLKDWRKFYADQLDEQKEAEKNAGKEEEDGEEGIPKEPKPIDFTKLRLELSKHHLIMLHSAQNLQANLSKILALEKKLSAKKFNDFESVKQFIKEALKQGIITKIKYGAELENISKENSTLSLSEQEMLRHAVSAELGDFCSKFKDLSKSLSSLSNSIKLLGEVKAVPSSAVEGVMEKRITPMSRIAKNLFDLQSLFLDELDLPELAKSAPSNEQKFVLTIGKDIFLTKQLARKFSYPEDFGLSRWREEKEPPKIIIQLSPVEKFCKKLMFVMSNTEGNNVCVIDDWKALRESLCEELKITPSSDSEILAELEKHKFEKEFSFEKLFFVSEAIKNQNKKK